ncbi:PEP-CTERM sorting domain-containing protein [Nostoc sp. ChiVER01]|uniref:PEP-CTERM sorting domain-containing protein n=1 Tax=Nostoc sp. ChiVER01 TaxID=3075382 RepID=UPI002AD2F007|nr:PEP-CTERM sorting domain-containing protein [Nostoc sp. ChiVER01]MDZ8226471.1 PEP-CTERM sorting domain-containing protein [Nostoc sp. ChiVER01]
MINFKSRLLNATLAVTAAIPLATAGLFTSAGSAQAAALVGEFSLTGDGSASLLENSFTFSNPKTFTISSDPDLTTGTFTGFTKGSIGNILSFAPTIATNPFLDLGTDAATIGDGFNTFAVSSASYTLTQAAANLVSINVITDGFFKSALGEISQGQGIFTLQTTGTIATIKDNWKKGTAVKATYSSLYFATVPEPTTLIGLGLVGAGMVMSRRRKSFV